MTALDVHSVERNISFAVIVVCMCAFAATAMVCFGHFPAVFNQGLRANLLINIGLLILLAFVIGALTTSLFRAKARWIRRPVLVGVTVLVTLDALLFIFDKTAISVKGSLLPTASYSVKDGDGLINLRQPNDTSPYGFRTPQVEPRIPRGKRILFLGNSYIEGSGSTFATNYPQAVEAALQTLMPGQNITVFSAGVNGYGVDDDRLIYSYLQGQGYHFDMVVLNFMMGSDPTNDMPETIRMAIAGQPQRLHQNRFLRTFYPLDTYLFRYIVYLNVTFNSKLGGSEVTFEKKGAPCTQTLGFISFASERANYYYGTGAQKRIDMPAIARGIDGIHHVAQKNGVPFLMVMIPDQYSMLARNRDRFADVPMDWQWIRNDLLRASQGKYPTLDLSNTFQDQSPSFRCSDTHWTDEGNLRAANVVADWLAKFLAGVQVTSTSAR